jgi:hypothetical protein
MKVYGVFLLWLLYPIIAHFTWLQAGSFCEEAAPPSFLRALARETTNFYGN